jgi:hypothetical protein
MAFPRHGQHMIDAQFVDEKLIIFIVRQPGMKAVINRDPLQN